MTSSAQQSGDSTPAASRRVWFRWDTILASAAALAIAFGIVFIAWMILRPLAILLMSIILAETLEPVVQRLQRRFSRTVAVLTAYAGILLIIVFLVLTIVPSIIGELGDLGEEIPDAQERLMDWLDEREWISADQVTNFLEGQAEGGGELAQIPFLVVSAILDLALAIFLSIYWLLAKPGAKSLMLSMVPDHDRDRFEDIAAEVGSTVGGYIRGVVISGAILALVGFIGLTVIGIDYALPLAVVIFFGELVPILGPILAAIPALIVAAFDGLTAVLLVLGLFLLIQLLESSLIYPQVMKRQASIPPILVIFALLAGGSVGGIIGALVAIPLAGAIRVLVLRLVAPAVQGYMHRRTEAASH
jgi:predicted PurR-regulated permease PerM